MAAEIKYNGSVIATPEAGQTATLKCAGMQMVGDVVVDVDEVAADPVLQEKTATENGEVLPDEGYDGLSKVIVDVESSGGGLPINGIVEQYKVNAGATVNAGDFVEFVNRNFTDESIWTDDSISACALDDSRVLIVYAGRAYAVVITVSSSAIEIGEIVTYATGNAPFASVVALSSSKAVVVYRNNSNSYYGEAVVLSISGTTIAVGTKKVFASAETQYVSAVALSESSVFVAYKDVKNTASKAVILTISGTAISVGSTKTWLSGKAADYISAVKLTSAKVLVAYSIVGASTYAIVMTVSGTSITAGSVVSVGEKQIYVSVAALSDSKVLVVGRYNDSHAGVVSVLSVSGTTITVCTNKTFVDLTEASPGVVALSDSTAVVVYQDRPNLYHSTAIVLSVNGTTVSFGAKIVFDNAKSTKFRPVVLSEGKVFVAYDNNFGTFTLLTVDVATSAGGITMNIPVEPAISSGTAFGVAATSGAEGEMVDVYVVG